MKKGIVLWTTIEIVIGAVMAVAFLNAGIQNSLVITAASYPSEG